MKELLTLNYKTYPDVIWEIWKLQKEMAADLKTIKEELKNLKEN